MAFYTDISNWDSAAWDIINPNGIWKICDGESLPFLRWQGINCGNDGVVTITATPEISIYPNPVRDVLRIECTSEQVNKIEVFDVYGRNVFCRKQKENFPPFMEGWQPKADGVVLNVSLLPAGIYLVKLETDKGSVTKKFVKE